MTGHAVGAGEGGVKQRYSVHAAIPDSQITGFRIDSSEGKGLEAGRDAGMAHFAGQPPGACVVYLGSGTVIPLGVESLNHTRDTLLQAAGCLCEQRIVPDCISRQAG